MATNPNEIWISSLKTKTSMLSAEHRRKPVYYCVTRFMTRALVVLLWTVAFALAKECPREIVRNLLRNLKPLEYDLVLKIGPANKTGDFIVNGTVDIYVKFLPIKRTSVEGNLGTIASRLDGSCSSSSGSSNNKPLLDTISLKMEPAIELTSEPRVLVGSSIERLRLGKGQSMEIEEIARDSKWRMLTLRMSTSFPKNSFGRISIEFSRNGHTSMGLTSSGRSERVDNGATSLSTSWLTFINTRFQPAFAHHVFPCFDAPRFRAKFLLTIEADKRLAVYSNMPAASGLQMDLGNGFSRTAFQQSPPIAVHKLAISAGHYDDPLVASMGSRTDNTTDGPLVIRVIAPKGMSSWGRFALELARESLDWLTAKLTGRQLPILKLDLIATYLGDLNVTDSLGCVLINQDFMLINELESSPERKILAAFNVAQALVRQWFGNLVAPERWADNWIIEGVAVHLAIDMLTELRPDLGLRHYVRSHLLPRFMLLRGKYPTRDSYNKPTELETRLLDALEPIKSASLISMLQNLIGRDQLYSAIKMLLLLYASQGDDNESQPLVTVEKFTEILASTSNCDMTQTQLDKYLMLWREYPTFPLISVLFDQTERKVVIYQNQIEHSEVLDFDRIKLSSFQDAVQVPIKVMFSNLDNTRWEIVQLPLDVFRKRPSPMNPMANLVKVPVPDWFDWSSSSASSSGHWLKIVSEPNELPFYCIRYAQDIIDRMRPAIQSGNMNRVDKIALLSDVSVLDRMNSAVMYKQPMEKFISWFGGAHDDDADDGEEELETEILIEMLQAKFSQVNSSYRGIKSLSQGDSLRLLPICRKIFKQYGFAARPNESIFEQFARASALHDLIMDDDQEVIDVALEAFDGADPLAAFLKGPIYTAIARAGSQEQQAKLIDKLREASWPEEIERLEAAIGRIKPPVRVKIESLTKWFHHFFDLCPIHHESRPGNILKR